MLFLMNKWNNVPSLSNPLRAESIPQRFSPLDNVTKIELPVDKDIRTKSKAVYRNRFAMMGSLVICPLKKYATSSGPNQQATLHPALLQQRVAVFKAATARSFLTGALEAGHEGAGQSTLTNRKVTMVRRAPFPTKQFTCLY